MFDPAPLESYLRAQPLGGEKLRVTSARRLQGGRSKVTLLLSLADAAGLPSEVIVRQDWDGSVTGRSVVHEHKLLARLHAEGIRVPPPLLVETEANVAGHPFIVVPLLRGSPVGDNFMVRPATDGPLMQLAEQMAAFHGIGVETWRGMAGIVDSTFSSDQARDTLAGYRQR